ncbi:hypothetical protein EUTSA_v10001236mg [Eutrema salsugineum]|uniref:F-box domain-containing protein n=1 Tax=Eutrema salsugineum TaxID=72664 RepID=V4LIJ2_EUTSA|nr:hypothetical protein EUTSA_v10001236mg [Eutrema salsugineum]
MGCDRISELPESLLTQILSYLPTKDSVKTSVLLKRWENLWLRVPVLDLNVSNFPRHGKGFRSFIENFLEFNKKSRILQGYIYIDNPKFVVSWPSLKIMHLEQIIYDDAPLIMEKFISGCPVLEDLTVIDPQDYSTGGLQLLRVKSQSLKSFRLTFDSMIMDGAAFAVEIDASRLEHLSFEDNQFAAIAVKNLASLFMIKIDIEFDVMSCNSPLEPEDLSTIVTIHDFLTGISSVRHMIISESTVKVLYLYSHYRPIPKFDNLYRLETDFSRYMLQFLPVFLESCPNLRNLIVKEFWHRVPIGQTELTYVPQCLVSTLECVEIKNLDMEEESWKKLVRYFLENSVVLKKLLLRFRGSFISNRDSVFNELLTYTKLSPSCEIVIH